MPTGLRISSPEGEEDVGQIIAGARPPRPTLPAPNIGEFFRRYFAAPPGERPV
ncbi:MAG: hypothetical protein WA419_20685 [Silvibacterium sp.]